MSKKPNIGCVSLIGELADWGKHIYFKDEGVTACGCFTVDYNKERYKNMPDGVTSEYKSEEWDITCEKCLNVVDLIEAVSETKKANKN